MTKAPNTVEVTYESFRIPVQLADYRTITLTDEERERAVQQASAVPESQQGLTTDYFLQAAFVEKVASNSTLRVPKQIAHERALLHGPHTLQQKLESDQLSLDDYLKAMKTTKDQLIAEFEVEAKRQLRQRIVLLAIAKAEGLEALLTPITPTRSSVSPPPTVCLPRAYVGFFAASGENESVRQDISVSKAADFMKQLVLN